MGEVEKPVSRLDTLRKASESIPKAPAKPATKAEPAQDLPKEFHDARQKEAKRSLDIDAEEHRQAMTGQKDPEVLQQLTDEWKQAKAQTKAIKAQHLKNIKAEKPTGDDGFLDAGDAKKSDPQPLSQADDNVKQSDSLPDQVPDVQESTPFEEFLKAYSEQEAKVGKEIRARIEAKKKQPVKPKDYEKDAFDPEAPPNARLPKDPVEPVSTAKAMGPATPATPAASAVKQTIQPPKSTAEADNILELDNRSLAQQLEERQKASRQSISIDTTVEKATEEIKDQLSEAYFGQTLKERMIIEPNASVNPDELWKQTRVMEKQGAKFMEMLEDAKKAYRQGTITLDQAQRTIREMLITKHIETSTSNLKGTSGRSQRNIRAIKEAQEQGKSFKLADGTDYVPLSNKELNKTLADVQEGLERAGLNEMDLLRAMVSIDDAKHRNRLMKSIGPILQKAENASEVLYQQMIAQMMFDPSTHAMNVGSGFLAGAYNGAIYTAGALKHEILRPISQRPIGEARLADVGRFWGESMAAIPKALFAFGQLSRGKQEIIQDLMVREAQALRLGDNPTEALLRTKVDSAIHDNPLLITINPKLMFRQSMWKAGWNRIVNFSTISLRALGNADVALRHIMGMGEQRFRASAKARAIADTKIGPDGDPKEWQAIFEAHRKKFFDNPFDHAKLADESFKAAEEGLFLEELERGGFQHKLGEIRKAHPIMKFAIPFYNTLMGFANYSARRIPGFNILASKRFRSQLFSDDPFQRQIAHGNLVVGSGVGLLGWQLSESANITGAAPHDPRMARDLQELGWKPYHIKVNDQLSVSYKNIPVIGDILGGVANIRQMSGYLNQEAVGKAWAHFIGDTGSLMMDHTIAQGTYDQLGLFMKLFDEGADKASDQMWANEIKKASVIGVSGALRFGNRLVDPTVYQPETILERVSNGIPQIGSGVEWLVENGNNPWAKHEQRVRRDLTGEIVYYDGDIPGEENMVTRALSMIAFSKLFPKAKPTPLQKVAIEIMQPMYERGVHIPRIDAGQFAKYEVPALTESQWDAYQLAYLKGRADLPGLENPLLQDVKAIYDGFLEWEKTQDTTKLEVIFGTGYVSDELERGANNNKRLQALISSYANKRKDRAKDFMLSLDENTALRQKIATQEAFQQDSDTNIRNPQALVPLGHHETRSDIDNRITELREKNRSIQKKAEDARGKSQTFHLGE